MSEEIKEQEQPTEAKPEEAERWKSEARKWEKRAQENLAELEALKTAQMSETEKATARAEKAERELEQFKADAQRASDAVEVSKQYNVPVWLVDKLPDRESMVDVAKHYTEDTRTPRAPKHTVEPVDSGAKPSLKEQFAAYAAAQLNK